MRKTLASAVLFHVLSTVSAGAGPALLFDAASGAVLYAEEVDHSWHPASLTKLMTAYLAFEALKAGTLKADDKLVSTTSAVNASPSKLGLPLGAEIAVDLALKALIVKSANDMAIMLAEKIGGSEAKFADMMTAKAKSLGMARSRFVNASGLPDARQTTSARDMALLARALIRDFPEHASLFAMPAVAIGKKKLGSHNGLLKTFAGADGMKTGFICDSGYNIVASATRSGTRLVAVVLGEPTGAARTDRTRSLLEYGFETHSWKTFLGGAATIETLPADQAAPMMAVSIRSRVEAWACGWRRAAKARTAKAKKAKKDAKAVARAATGTAATASAAIADTTTSPAGAATLKKKTKKSARTAAKNKSATANAAAGTVAGATTGSVVPKKAKTAKKKKALPADDATASTTVPTATAVTAPAALTGASGAGPQ